MENKYPFYLKSTIILFGLILVVYTLSNLGEVLVPLSYALLIAVLLNPVSKILERLHVSRIAAILLTMLLAFIILAGIGYFLTIQITSFSDQLPILENKFNDLVTEAQQFLNAHFGLDLKKQRQYIEQIEGDLKPLIGATFGTLMGSFGLMVLLPVYTFLLLFYKNHLLDFLHEVFGDTNPQEVNTILKQTQGAIQHYMFGLLVEGFIVAILNSIALLLLGVKYAILLGTIGAILNVVPYIGGIIAIALPVIMATITKDGFHTQLLIIISYLIIQFIDNHFLIPYIVSSKVKINALVSVVIVLLGGMLWGFSGMFLSIPFIGVLKIIFDRIPELKPWGKLLGTEVSTTTNVRTWKRKGK